MRLSKYLNEAKTNPFNVIKKKYSDLANISFIVKGNGFVELSKIIIAKENRKDGLGSKIMQDIIDIADKKLIVITTTPSTDFGGSSVSRLKKFYKKFGFVENKGKNREYEIFESMYRTPK